jgi:hypothetical protein
MIAEFSPDGAIYSNSVPEAAAWQRFHSGTLVLRVHRLDPVFGVLCKQTFSDRYAIHDSAMN